MSTNTNSMEKTKKKNIFSSIFFDGQTVNETPNNTKWTLFKSVFFNRFGTMVFLNILTALFAVPGAIVIILFYFNSSIASSLLPYSANFGIGYPVAVNVDSIGVLTSFYYNLFEFLFLIPCIALFSVGISGNLNVLNKLAAGEEAKTFKDFFRGIKKSGLSAFFVGLIFGILVLFVAISLCYFDAYNISVVYKAITVTVSIIALVFAIMYIPFFMTQGVCFKLKVGTRLKNSFFMLLGTFLQSIVMSVIAVAPLFTVFIPGFTMFFVMIFVLLGISYTSLVFVLHCRQCCSVFSANAASDAAANYAKKDKDQAIECSESGTDQVVTNTAKKKVQNVQYKNPKKKKRDDITRNNN